MENVRKMQFSLNSIYLLMQPNNPPVSVLSSRTLSQKSQSQRISDSLWTKSANTHGLKLERPAPSLWPLTSRNSRHFQSSPKYIFHLNQAKNLISRLYRLTNPLKANPRPRHPLQTNRHKLQRIHHYLITKSRPGQTKLRRYNSLTKIPNGLNRHRQERHDQLQLVRSSLSIKLNPAQ